MKTKSLKAEKAFLAIAQKLFAERFASVGFRGPGICKAIANTCCLYQHITESCGRPDRISVENLFWMTYAPKLPVHSRYVSFLWSDYKSFEINGYVDKDAEARLLALLLLGEMYKGQRLEDIKL